MSDVDYYDVQRMIEVEASRLRGKISDLEEEIRLLKRDLDSERMAREDADRSLGRVLNSRTEHLV